MSRLFKRRTILQTLVGSLIALFGGEAIAAVGPTLQCTRVGQKIVYRGFTYSCIKSKGKLVWKKGAMVSVVKSTPTPTSKGVVIAQSSQIGEGTVKIIQARDNPA